MSPTEAALLIEGLCGQSEKVTHGGYRVVGQLVVAAFRAGMLTIRIAYSLDGQEVRPTPA
jgi:hypothetical protein